MIMTDFVNNREDYTAYKSRFAQLFKVNTDFENNPFNESFECFLDFEFDFIYHESFFKGLKTFLGSIGNKSVIFYTIEPSPEDYFYRNFGKYSVFEISIKATDKELNDIMMKNPQPNTADAIAITSDYISWFSDSNSWAIIGSRDREIAVAGFINSQTRELFLSSFDTSSDMFWQYSDFKEIVKRQ